MSDFVKVNRVYLSGGIPVVDVTGANAYIWRGVKTICGGEGNRNSCWYTPPMSQQGLLARSGTLSNPWAFFSGSLPAAAAGNSLFEDRTEAPPLDAELPELCTVRDMVVCNGTSTYRIDEFGNVCTDTRRAQASVRTQMAPGAKAMFILSQPGTVDATNLTEGLLLANRTLTYLNDELATKLNTANAAISTLHTALLGIQSAAAAGGSAATLAAAISSAITTALLPYSAPTNAAGADDNLTSGAFLVTDLSIPEVEDTYNFGDGE